MRRKPGREDKGVYPGIDKVSGNEEGDGSSNMRNQSEESGERQSGSNIQVLYVYKPMNNNIDKKEK